jgi:glutathione S-transferase
MAGAEFSAADVQMMFPLEFAAFARLVDARHAELRDYLARMQARPAYRRAVDRGRLRLRWSRKRRGVMRAHGIGR